MSFKIIEEGLTFFECISRSIGNCTGQNVHSSLLYYFMKIVFNNANYKSYQEFCQAIKREETKELELKPTIINNEAVKEWIKRVSQKEKSVSNRVDVWFASYPKFLKAVMLRFFYWHRDYKKKPYRIYCKYVFSHLAADFYKCSIGILEEGGGGSNTFGVRWFYPLGAQDYYQINILNCIVIQKEKKQGSFTLLNPPEKVRCQGSVIPLLLVIDSEEEEDEEGEYVS